MEPLPPPPTAKTLSSAATPSSSAIIVRAAVEADLPALVALLRSLFDIEADFDFDERKQRAGLSQLVSCPTAAVFVACTASPAEKDGGAGAGERVVGMATCQVRMHMHACACRECQPAVTLHAGTCDGQGQLQRT